jgi:hypothetical protein
VNGAKYTEARDEIQRLYNRIDDYMADLSKDFEKQDGNLLELGPSKD